MPKHADADADADADMVCCCMLLDWYAALPGNNIGECTDDASATHSFLAPFGQNSSTECVMWLNLDELTALCEYGTPVQNTRDPIDTDTDTGTYIGA